MSEAQTGTDMEFEQQLAWTRQHMPLTRAQAEQFPDLSGLKLALSTHLDIKMIPAFEPLLARGAGLFITTCNPQTVRNRVVEYLLARGAEAHAWHGMSPQDEAEALQGALAWGPTHLCEMGAQISAALIERGQPHGVRASLEATGSGISLLSQAGRALSFPVFNWDDLPIKEGLHNRYLVGLGTWQTFVERTHLSLHGKRVLLIGFGLVGQGVASAARAFGGTVSVAERDPARLLEARYAGYEVGSLEALLPQADLIVTATGAKHVLNTRHFPQIKPGCILLNVGHSADEIETAALHPRRDVIPFVEEISLAGRSFYLFAGGYMANLSAGQGDTLNAFDLTLATMLAGLRFIFSAEAASYGPGLHPLPRSAWEPVAAQAAASL